MIPRDDYPQGECPDCGEDIPECASYGEGCSNCGHVFNPLIPDDD